jgi:hypothetical protein
METVGLARNTDPDTSKAAAEGVPNLEGVVYEAIRTLGRCIADDVVEHLGMRWDSVTPRFSSLIRKGLVRDTGERRKGRSGRSQRVMEAI